MLDVSNLDTSKSASACRFQKRRTELRSCVLLEIPLLARWSIQRASVSSRAAQGGYQVRWRRRSGPPEGVDQPGYRQPPRPLGRADERASGPGPHSGGGRTVQDHAGEQLRPPGDPAAGRRSMQGASGDSRAAQRSHQTRRWRRSGPPAHVPGRARSFPQKFLLKFTPFFHHFRPRKSAHISAPTPWSARPTRAPPHARCRVKKSWLKTGPVLHLALDDLPLRNVQDQQILTAPAVNRKISCFRLRQNVKQAFLFPANRAP